MRGLKQLSISKHGTTGRSHLLQMRGLKQRERIMLTREIVASFTDAWIETPEVRAYNAGA